MKSLWRRLSGAERLLFVVFVVTLPLATPLIRGDGVGYYAYARSVLIDGDLRFEKDWLSANASFVRGVTDASGRIRPDQYTPTGYLANHFTVGPALLWLPLLGVTHLLVLGGRRLGVTVPADGYSWPYRGALALATATYSFIGLLLAFQMARRYASERLALLATLGIWFGSSLPVYMYFNPAWSHALSAFAVSLFLWYWFRTRGRRTQAQWIILGLLGALMVNVYYPNGVLLIVPGLEALRTYGAGWKIGGVGQVRLLAIRHLAFGGAMLAGLLPTLMTRKIIFGSALASGYLSLHAWCWGHPWLGEVLFSSNHGLFSWTPILLPASAGLAWVAARDREVGLYLILACVAFYYLIASYPTWYGLSSFGNRFLVSLTPVFVVGLAAVLAGLALRPAAAVLPIVVGALVLWNLGLIFQWGTKMIPNRGPVDWGEVARNQLEVPRRAAAVTTDFIMHRGRLLSVIQQEDLREAESWKSTAPPCL